MADATGGSSARSPSAARPARILVADDDPLLRRLLGHVLRRAGNDVEEVEDGPSVLARLGTADKPRVDVVVSDVEMPGMSGFEVLEKIRATASLVPVILCTAHRDAATASRAHEMGALVLPKPVDPGGLCLAVRRLATRAPRTAG